MESRGNDDVTPRRMSEPRGEPASHGPVRVAEPQNARPTGERIDRRDVRESVRDPRPVERRRADLESRGGGGAPSSPSAESTIRPVTGDSVRDWRAIERRRADSPTSIEQRNLRRPPLVDRSGEDLVEPVRRLPPVLDPTRDRRVSRTPMPGTEPPAPRTATADVAQPRHRWRDDWRRDRRFDWRDHRRRHRSLFRLAFYLDPFGWRYHRYGVGWRLWPSYYSSRYWLNDPWMYRLPPAYGPYRWIRYYDDALLVNIYTGQVVDVIHNFFW